MSYYKASTREMLIRRLQTIGRNSVFERAALRLLPSSRRKQARAELALLLSEGFVIRLGTGRRGDGYRIILSGTWPFNKCPLCGHVKQCVPKILVTE